MSESSHAPRPFLIYGFIVLVTALAAAVYSWESFPPQYSTQLALLCVAVLLSENFAFSIEPYSISLAFPLSMAGAVLCGPAAGCLVAALSATNYREIKSHKPLSAIVFNLGQLVLSAAIAAWAYFLLGGRFLQGPHGAFQPWTAADFPSIVVPMVAAAILAVGANMLLTAGAMALLTARRIESTVGTMVAFVPTQLALALVGYLIAQALAINPLALPLFIAPLAVARQLYMRYAGLKTAYVDTVRSLVGALEAKDPYTRGHSERVSGYAAALGHALSLGPRDLERLEYAALLHDIGKLAVASSVLTKPGKLDSDEMERIREHPARGASMIRRIPPLRDLADAVEQHHEWFDGTGYPAHRPGTELSSAARILSVADCYDAMTTTRAYRRALSREEAIAELIDGAGSQFDAEIVRVFVECRLGRGAEAAADSSGAPETTEIPAAVAPGVQR